MYRRFLTSGLCGASGLAVKKRVRPHHLVVLLADTCDFFIVDDRYSTMGNPCSFRLYSIHGRKKFAYLRLKTST